MMLMWKRRLPKVRSIPSWRVLNTVHCARVCGTNSREPKKICSARVDEPPFVEMRIRDSMGPVDEIPTDGAN